MGIVNEIMGWTEHTFTQEYPIVATLGKRRKKYENICNYSIAVYANGNSCTDLSKYEPGRHAENDARDAENAVMLGTD
jgi:hypothetical protein